MPTFTKTAAEIFAPFTAGGVPRRIDNNEAVTWGTEVEGQTSFQRPGIASPAILSLIEKMSQVADIRDWDGVDLTGANDEASIVQAAVTETSGLTNPVPVRFPGCKIALGAPITTYNGTIIEGLQAPGGSYDSKCTWFHLAHSGVGFTNLDNLGAQRFTKFGTYRTQPTPGGGAFTPNPHDFDFDLVGAQDIVFEDICTLNPTKAWRVRGNGITGAASGRIFFNRISGQPLQEGFRFSHCLDSIYLDQIHLWPKWNGVNAQVAAYMRANASAFILGRVDNPKLGTVFCYGYYRGMLVIHDEALVSLPAGTVSLLQCSVFGADNCSAGLIVNTGTDGASLSFDSFYAAANPSPAPSTENFLWTLGNNAQIDIQKLHGQYTSGALVGLNGTGNVVDIESARSVGLTGTEFISEAGNRLRLGRSPITSTAGAIYGGAGIIETPDLRAWTPTCSSQSGTNPTFGSVVARYMRRGKLVEYDLDIPITANNTGAGDIRFTLPFPGTNGRGYGRETSVTGLGLAVTIDASGLGIITVAHTNGYPGGTNHRLRVQGRYEATT